jgi:hypothetical protein
VISTKPKESKLERDCVAWARDRGILVTKNDTRANKGVPDRVFWLPGGRSLVVEFKAPGKRPTALQKTLLDCLKDAGYWACAVDDFEVFRITVEQILKGGKLKWVKT